MSARYLLGIDVGTSFVKAALFDSSGREVGVASRRGSVSARQPGWSEANMDQVWRAVAATIGEALVAADASGADIAAIGVSGNMVGAWLLDAAGEPVRDAILWNDGRTQELIEQLVAARPSLLHEIFACSGSVMQPGCTLPILAWLKRHEPQSLDRACTVLSCKDWIRFKLIGALHSDPTEASVRPGDARARSHSARAGELLGVADLQHLLAPLAQSEAIVGTVTPSAASATGLRAGTPVVAGAGDVPAVALGVGATEPGVACSILGTICINGLVLGAPLFEPADVGLLFCLPGDRWLRAFANIAGTTNLDWFAAQFCAVERAQASDERALFGSLEALASSSPLGARGVIYHPYLSSLGVIAPFVEPGARAQFWGLSAAHTRADMLRAIYEGVALAIRDCYAATGLALGEIRLCGGGARSLLWQEIIADCVGVPVLVAAGEEQGAKGAALLAGVGLGWYPNVADAARDMAQVARVVEPRLANYHSYSEIYGLYRELRELLRGPWQRRSRHKSNDG